MFLLFIFVILSALNVTMLVMLLKKQSELKASLRLLSDIQNKVARLESRMKLLRDKGLFNENS
jgi:hypothetical protein